MHKLYTNIHRHIHTHTQGTACVCVREVYGEICEPILAHILLSASIHHSPSPTQFREYRDSTIDNILIFPSYNTSYWPLAASMFMG